MQVTPGTRGRNLTQRVEILPRRVKNPTRALRVRNLTLLPRCLLCSLLGVKFQFTLPGRDSRLGSCLTNAFKGVEHVVRPVVARYRHQVDPNAHRPPCGQSPRGHGQRPTIQSGHQAHGGKFAQQGGGKAGAGRSAAFQRGLTALAQHKARTGAAGSCGAAGGRHGGQARGVFVHHQDPPRQADCGQAPAVGGSRVQMGGVDAKQEWDRRYPTGCQGKGFGRRLPVVRELLVFRC